MYRGRCDLGGYAQAQRVDRASLDVLCRVRSHNLPVASSSAAPHQLTATALATGWLEEKAWDDEEQVYAAKRVKRGSFMKSAKTGKPKGTADDPVTGVSDELDFDEAVVYDPRTGEVIDQRELLGLDIVARPAGQLAGTDGPATKRTPGLIAAERVEMRRLAAMDVERDREIFGEDDLSGRWALGQSWRAPRPSFTESKYMRRGTSALSCCAAAAMSLPRTWKPE